MDNKSNIAAIKVTEGHAPHARLLRPGEGSTLSKEFDRDAVPFVPAFDLLEQTEKSLSPEQVAAVAFALSRVLPSEENPELGNWSTLARISAVSNRL